MLSRVTRRCAVDKRGFNVRSTNREITISVLERRLLSITRLQYYPLQKYLPIRCLSIRVGSIDKRIEQCDRVHKHQLLASNPRAIRIENVRYDAKNPADLLIITVLRQCFKQSEISFIFYIYKGYTARNTDNQQRHLKDDHDTALSPDKSHSTVDINTIADSSITC